MQSNSSWYYTQHCDDGNRMWIRLQTHNRHPIPCPHGQVKGSLWWQFLRKYTALYGTVILVILWSPKPLPLSCSYGQPMDVFCEFFGEKCPWYVERVLFITHTTILVWTFCYIDPSAPHSISIYHESGWWGGLAVWWPLTHGVWHFIITQTSIDGSSQGKTQYEVLKTLLIL